jgi:hypothetical protein
MTRTIDCLQADALSWIIANRRPEVSAADPVKTLWYSLAHDFAATRFLGTIVGDVAEGKKPEIYDAGVTINSLPFAVDEA